MGDSVFKQLHEELFAAGAHMTIRHPHLRRMTV